MRIDWGNLLQGLIVGVLLAVLAAGISTYIEVKMLRHDVTRLEGIIDSLVENSK
jgi:hypothetical protein